MRRLAVLLALLPLAGAASAQGDDVTPLLEGRIAGPPQRCIDPRRMQAPVFSDDGRIAYRQNRSRVFVSTPIGRCPWIVRRAILVTRSTTGQICRGHSFRVVTSDNPRASAPCRFGSFVPYDRGR